jgi:transposase
MARPLNFHKPTRAELRQLLQWLETITDPIIRQRIEVIVTLCFTPIATEVAQLLDLHVNTVLYYMRCFNRRRLRWITVRKKGGRTPQIPQRMKRQIVAIAQHAPSDFGLPYGTWSLARLQWFVTQKRKLLRRISREHLRRILKKTMCSGVASSARSIPTIRGARSF